MQNTRLIWFLAVIASLTPVFAQTAAGVNGIILDSSGAVMPATQVTITNIDTGAKRDALTNENGRRPQKTAGHPRDGRQPTGKLTGLALDRG